MLLINNHLLCFRKIWLFCRFWLCVRLCDLQMCQMCVGSLFTMNVNDPAVKFSFNGIKSVLWVGCAVLSICCQFILCLILNRTPLPSLLAVQFLQIKKWLSYTLCISLPQLFSNIVISLCYMVLTL